MVSCRTSILNPFSSFASTFFRCWGTVSIRQWPLSMVSGWLWKSEANQCHCNPRRYSSSDWVTQYRMLYSDTGRNWKPYHQDGNIWVSRCQKGKHRTEWQICDPNPPSPGGVLGRWKGLGVTWLKVNCAIFVSCLSVCVLWYLLKEKRNVSEAKESGEMDLNPIVPCPTPCLS